MLGLTGGEYPFISLDLQRLSREASREQPANATCELPKFCKSGSVSALSRLRFITVQEIPWREEGFLSAASTLSFHIAAVLREAFSIGIGLHDNSFLKREPPLHE